MGKSIFRNAFDWLKQTFQRPSLPKQASSRANRQSVKSVDGAQGFRARLLRWGPFAIPEREATQHFAAIGATGSGKTSIIRLLLQSIVPTIFPGSDRRICINDPKNEILPILGALKPKCQVIIADPFDIRSHAWDMAADVDEPRVALETAYTLIPEKHESQPYFSDAARHIVYGVFLSYQQRGLEWTFADVLRALQSPKLLKRVLLACPYTRSIVDCYFAEKKTLSNILSTVATKTLAYQHIAAAWESAERTFSIKEWVSGSSILVLGHSEISRHSLAAINQCIKKRISDQLLSQSDSDTRYSFDVTDELSDAGHIPGLVSLAKKGRSKGVSLVLGFQSIEGLRAKEVFGPEQTADLLGQIGYRFFGRMECAATAKWASELIGDQEVIQTTQSWSKGKESSESTTEHYATRNTVLPSELSATPACTPENGLTAWYLNRCHDGVVRAHMDGNQLFGSDLIPPSKEVKDFMPRSPECQLLRPWTKEEQTVFAPVFKKETAAKAKPQPKETIDFTDVDNL